MCTSKLTNSIKLTDQHPRSDMACWRNNVIYLQSYRKNKLTQVIYAYDLTTATCPFALVLLEWTHDEARRGEPNDASFLMNEFLPFERSFTIGSRAEMKCISSSISPASLPHADSHASNKAL